MDAPSAERDREQQLLDAAEDLMCEGRTLAFSLGDVADRVGVSRSLLYVYFEGVPAIVDTLFLRHLDRLEARLLPEFDAAPAPYRDRASAAYAAYLDYLIESGPILQLILRERHQDSPLGSASQRKSPESTLQQSCAQTTPQPITQPGSTASSVASGQSYVDSSVCVLK